VPAILMPQLQNIAWAASSDEEAGEVITTEGIVFIRADNQATREPRPAKPGDKLKTGDVVNTSSNGKIKILLKDKTIVDLGPSALFKVEKFAKNDGKNREVDLNMIYGKMRTAVTQKIEGKGRFHVRTPNATMGVRGTEFIVQTEFKNFNDLKQALKNAGSASLIQLKSDKNGKPKGKTEVTVIQGEVAVGVDKNDGAARIQLPTDAVGLTKGMQVIAKDGDLSLGKPVILDQKQLNVAVDSATVVDNTFTKAVVIDVPKPENGASGQSSGSRDPASNAYNSGTANAAAAVGAETLDAIKTTVSNTPAPVLPPITFNQPVDVFNPIPVNTQGSMKNLRVIVVMPPTN
jgi:hypothetical protein